MSLTFKEKGHKYESIDPNENIEWTSVTSLIHKFQEPFDAEKIAERSSKSKRSKWHGISPERILEIWANENKRAIDLGSYYHNQREIGLLECDTIQREGFDLPIIPPKVNDGLKYAPDQKLIAGIYPEHFVYLKSAGVCGQADRVEVVNGFINIYDYKTNKEIKTEPYINWEGIRKTLQPPMSHIDDCNLMHYTLQMSTYMYIMLKHNRKLRPGKMVIEHIVFEKEGDDEFGYPIIKYTEDGNPIVKEVVPYDVPYLKEEVVTMINWLKEDKK
jgi:hypothetical protein